MTTASSGLQGGTTLLAQVQDYFTAFGGGDIDGALRLMTEDVVWHVDGVQEVSTVGLLRGPEQVRGWLESFPGHFRPREFSVDQLLESGDTVLALGRFRHTVLSTGHTVGSDFVIRFGFRDGLIARYQIFEDSALLARAFDPSDGCERQQIRINGTSYGYTDRGEGPVIMFTHGLFVDRRIFEAQVEALARDYRCIVLDMPGHGESGYRSAGWSLEDVAADLALMIEELSLGPVIFVGQSQGGMVGIRLAACWPGLVKGLILVGTSARAEYAERIEGWERLKQVILHGTDVERRAAFSQVQQRLNPADWLARNSVLAEQELAVMMSHDRSGLSLALEAAVLARQDIRALLSGISVPTLVVCGEEDGATPLELGEEIARGISGADLRVLPGVGHHPPLEAPVELLQLVRGFCAGSCR